MPPLFFPVGFAMTHMKKAITLTFLLAATAVALADGFSINEQGARAMAQAGAFAARASDPSAIYFNPAGITQLEEACFYSGATTIKQKTTWECGGQSVESNDKWEFPPHFYFCMPLNDRWHVGVGLFAPFGLSKRWMDDFPGKYSSQLVNLQVMELNPTVAVKVTDKVSVAVGVAVVRAMARLDRAIYLQDLSDRYFGGYPLPDGYFSANVEKTSFGYNFGVHAKLSDKLFLGASYRGQVKLKLKGDLTLTMPTTPVPAINQALATLFPSQACETELTLPDTAMVGIGGKITDRWDTEVDIQWTHWTDYDELPFRFSQQTAAIQDTNIIKDWRAGWTLRWGHEYHLDKHQDIRAGAYIDGAPNPDATLDPMLPDSTRLSVQGGYGWHKGHWTIDAAYMYLHFLKRSIENDPSLHILPNQGLYKSHAHLFGISVGYKF